MDSLLEIAAAHGSVSGPKQFESGWRKKGNADFSCLLRIDGQRPLPPLRKVPDNHRGEKVFIAGAFSLLCGRGGNGGAMRYAMVIDKRSGVV
ncbi:MAG: hypothetical protein C4563_10220 [Desulfobulbus sp.]|jgi:hypothetical protein|nr:MAG: hypothetical protein C4563_10220 [Desulfobulbus sp.]